MSEKQRYHNTSKQVAQGLNDYKMMIGIRQDSNNPSAAFDQAKEVAARYGCMEVKVISPDEAHQAWVDSNLGYRPNPENEHTLFDHQDTFLLNYCHEIPTATEPFAREQFPTVEYYGGCEYGETLMTVGGRFVTCTDASTNDLVDKMNIQLPVTLKTNVTLPDTNNSPDITSLAALGISVAVVIAVIIDRVRRNRNKHHKPIDTSLPVVHETITPAETPTVSPIEDTAEVINWGGRI